MQVKETKVENNSESIVCWNRQSGGLEELRQKGWSIDNLLVIKREGLKRNTQLKILAQEDNQVICTIYKTQNFRDDDELKSNIKNIVQNNGEILRATEIGITKIGLQINKDETLQAADFMTYGKTPIFRWILVYFVRIAERGKTMLYYFD